MTSRRIAIAAVVLLHFSALALEAQVTLTPPTAQTRQQLTKALQEYRQKKDPHGEAVTLLQLGIAEAGLGNVDGGRSNLVEAVRKLRAQNDPMGAWLALNILSQIEVALGRPAEAIAHMDKAVTVVNEAKVSTAPLTFKTFTAVGSASGFPPEMFEMLEGPNAAKMKPMMLQFFLEPMTHIQYGSVLTQVGQFDKAEAELKAAAAGLVHSQGMYDFSLESHWGDLRFGQQRYDEARAHYMKALNASSKAAAVPMADQHIKADIYDRLVRLETATGHPAEAKRWSEKAKELRKTPGSR